jgi:MAE_28990/MAE_18760-like HEPN
MPVRTIDELGDRLDEGIAWRKVELQALKSAISEAERRSSGSPLARALARSGVALLYAHWEGYVKDSCTAYVDFLARRRLRCGELNDGLLRTVLEGLAKRMATGDEEAREFLFDAIRRPDLSRARIPKSSMVDTKSNLRYRVLEEILLKIGLSADEFATKDKLIDVTLCDSRNSIAHGRDFFPSPDDFPALMDEVMGMMEQVRELILSAARLTSYRRAA